MENLDRVMKDRKGLKMTETMSYEMGIQSQGLE